MKRYLIAYVSILIVMPLLDAVWIGVIAKSLYMQDLGPLMSLHPRLVAAAAFYPLYALGVAVFVVASTLNDASWRRAAGLGVLFGLVAYSAYDLTNLATLRGFTVRLALIDMAWGAVLTAIAAVVGRLAALRLGADHLNT